MNQPTPRFEYRTFAQNLGRVEAHLQKLSLPGAVRESKEVYILEPGQWHRNVKLRGDRLELKELVERRQDLQRWRPAGQWNFPVPLSEIQETILPGFPFGCRKSTLNVLSKSQFLDQLVRDCPTLLRANVYKRRVGYAVDACSAEVDDILVNGASIRSVAIESEDADAVIETRQKLGLSEHENVSYPLAIARIMGLEPTSDESRYG